LIKSKFSVLLPVYFKDDALLFDRALASIFQSVIRPDEILIVQDGPVGQDLLNIIMRYSCNDIVKHIQIPVNVGLAKALNIGLMHIKNSYVFRADADDFNLPSRFQRQIALLDSGYDLVGSSILELDKELHPIAIRRTPSNDVDILRYLRRRNPFNHMTVAFRVNVVRDVGGYPDIHLKEDYALWATIISKGAKVCNIDDVLVHATAGRDMYRRRGGLRYVNSEIKLQKLLVRLGLQSKLNALFIGSFRSAVFLLPSAIRGRFYEYFLRRKI
jgi:glycosyltransferase involved in cell wall biosynthesis